MKCFKPKPYIWPAEVRLCARKTFPTWREVQCVPGDGEERERIQGHKENHILMRSRNCLICCPKDQSAAITLWHQEVRRGLTEARELVARQKRDRQSMDRWGQLAGGWLQSSSQDYLILKNPWFFNNDIPMKHCSLYHIMTSTWHVVASLPPSFCSMQ